VSNRLVICPFGFELSPQGVLVAPYGVVVMAADEPDQTAPNVAPADPRGPGIRKSLPPNVIALPAARRSA
jgi:hypothetical protein